MNAIEILKYSERLLDAGGNGLPFVQNNRHTFEHLNAAYFKVARRLAAFDVGLFEVSRDFTWVAPVNGRAVYALPSFFHQVKVASVRNSTGQLMAQIYPCDEIALEQGANVNWPAYFLKHRSLVLDTTEYDIQNAAMLRMAYYRSPAALHAFQPASVAAGNAIVLPTLTYEESGRFTIEDGYYVGAEYEVVIGPGIGESFTIETFDAATRTATLAAGTTTTATGESILVMRPSIPEDLHPLIANLLALEGTRIERNNKAYTLLRDEVASEWAEMKTHHSVRQVQASRYAATPGE